MEGLSPELAAMLLASVIGGYTLIGGLGATFYVSYFNTALIFVLILMLVIEVFYNPSQNPDNPFGSSDNIYELISCWREDEGNRGGSYLTFYSPGGLIFGIVNIVGNFGNTIYRVSLKKCDLRLGGKHVYICKIKFKWGSAF